MLRGHLGRLPPGVSPLRGHPSGAAAEAAKKEADQEETGKYEDQFENIFETHRSSGRRPSTLRPAGEKAGRDLQQILREAP